MQPIQQSPKHAAPSVVPVAIYTRVSTLHQVGGRFDSCESQAAICRDYVRKRAHEGWTEFSCHTDAAYSVDPAAGPSIISPMAMHMLPTTMASATFFFSTISAHRS